MPKLSSKPKVIGIVGSRRRATEADYKICQEELFKVFKRGDRLVSGGCPTGGDEFAERLAKLYQCTITIHYAYWNGPDGKRAGFVRNTLIAQEADVLIALLAETPGGANDTEKKFESLRHKKAIIC